MDEASVTTGAVPGSREGRRFTGVLTKARAARRRAERLRDEQADGLKALVFLIHDALEQLQEKAPLTAEQWEVLHSTVLMKQMSELGKGLGVAK